MSYSSARAASVVSRYRDAYRVANTIIGIGTAIKVAGAVLGIGIALVFMLGGAAVGRESGAAMFASVLTGGVLGAAVGLLFWLFGVLISSQGQVLLASLDTAVNGSPFITDDERATAMSLSGEKSGETPWARAAEAAPAEPETSASVLPQPRFVAGERTITCPQCGAVNPASLFYCDTCKRNLHM